MKRFNFKGEKYYFKYFDEGGENKGKFLIELSNAALNKHTPKHFVFTYSDNKVSFNAVTPEDFDIKCAVIKAILCNGDMDK